MNERRVVVSGVGLVCSAGLGGDTVWRNLQHNPPTPTTFTPAPPADDLTFPAFQIAPYDLREVGVPTRCLRWLESEGLTDAVDLRHMLASTALALVDAKLGFDLEDQPSPVAVVVGNESPGFEQLTQKLFQICQSGALPETTLERYQGFVHEFFQLNTFLLPYYLARAFHCSGNSLYVNSACTSGLNAIDIAVREIQCGRSDQALVSASDYPLSAAKFLWFDSLGLYAQDGDLKPYDACQTGTVFGDGGATLVLEALESARQRGAKIYAEIAGAGFAQDGWKISAPSPIKARARQAMESALHQAKMQVDDVDLVVTHGVGSAASDQYEAMNLNLLFEAHRTWPKVTTFKPLVGHNLGGCAILESALTLIAMQEGRVPPTPEPGRPYPRHPLPLNHVWSEQPIRSALKLTCGFAGFYGAVLFRQLNNELS